jgi:hypothetical protein
MHRLGVTVSGEALQVVHLDTGQSKPIVINQFTWKLQTGDVVDAYHAMHERVRDYVANHGVGEVIIKASAVGQSKPTLAHLRSAELRGVVCVGAKAGGAMTRLVQKAVISRTFGDRKADQYVEDDAFWQEALDGVLNKGRREAALLVLSQER